MLRQKLIINIWLLHLVGLLSSHFAHNGHRNLKLFRGILFTCCIQLLLYSSDFSKIGVIFNFFAIFNFFEIYVFVCKRLSHSVQLFRAHGQTDRHDEAHIRSSQFCEHAPKSNLKKRTGGMKMINDWMSWEMEHAVTEVSDLCCSSWLICFTTDDENVITVGITKVTM
jgi:hypothetical protein